MCVIEIWCRKCTVCQHVDEVEYSNHKYGCGSCTVVRTTLPEQSLQGANENYRCRGCRSRQAYESHQLNKQIMEARGNNKYGYTCNLQAKFNPDSQSPEANRFIRAARQGRLFSERPPHLVSSPTL
ncbi:uncharacterized protein FFB14_13804 [Fusarium fujikuroi]|nr:uncharacterized protein FFB14_13804 [Fusarium fujikuroi]